MRSLVALLRGTLMLIRSVRMCGSRQRVCRLRLLVVLLPLSAVDKEHDDVGRQAKGV